LTVATYTATGLTENVVYSFKVKAKNLVGFSLESDPISIRAATVPLTPIAPTTSVQSSDVKVTWVNPDNGGSPFTAYRVTVKQNDNTFSEETVTCDGSDSTILGQSYCLIPIATLRAAPFSHPWGASIYAKVVAINLVGESIESAEGNGAVILTTPDAPVSLQDDLPVTSAT